MLSFARTCEAVAATTKKLEKTALVAAYLLSLPLPESQLAAIFLSGRPFPSFEERTLRVGGALLWRTVAELSGRSEHEIMEAYRRHGDPGSVAAEVLPAKPESGISLADVQQAFSEIASARGPAAKAALLRRLLSAATPLEAKYIVKIVSGDLRIGLKESLVEEAIARAFERPLDQVQRANMLLGDIGETLTLAATDRLDSARLRLFHPIGFMLASPVESSEEALSYFGNASIEDKYDGIRAQVHIAPGEARLFSRTRDEISESFPELIPDLATFPKDAVLDGEIVAWNHDVAASDSPAQDSRGSVVPITHLRSAGETGVSAPHAAVHEDEGRSGRALPFSTLQQRLGRKEVSAKLRREVPVAFLVFDILYFDGELFLDRPLHDRRQALIKFLSLPRLAVVGQAKGQVSFAFGDPGEESPARTFPAPVAEAHSPADIERLFSAARERGNEGLMIKDLESLYTPGRRGKSWLKMKRELATLDVVVTAVEYGHGRRIRVLSDYTFAVWDGDRLVNIGKAYSGLTDAEIAEMTQWFLAHTIRERGLRLEVEPRIVLEVAFNNMMRSTRHESGYALRFPRIVRLRPDKLPEEADAIEAVKEIFDRQHQG